MSDFSFNDQVDVQESAAAASRVQMGSEMPKVEDKLGEDRISQMPDEILLHILSLLDDTFFAVQTTILSKRWNNLWVSIPSLKFAYYNYEECDDRCIKKECDDRFMTFFDRVVSLHDSADIRKFYLDYFNRGSRNDMLVDDCTRIQTCISTVIEHNVVELYLTLNNASNFTPEVPFLLPESLFKCNTLVVLKLDGFSFSNFPIDACLPRLKVLDIHFYFHYYDPEEADFPHNLVSSCPVLEDLTITGCHLDLDINISSPELKTLRIELALSYGLYSINAPKLETLDIIDDKFWPDKYLFENGSSLINVKLELLDYDHDHGGSLDGVIVLFAKFINVEYLCLDFYYLNLRDLNDFHLTKFVNLSQLVLVLGGFNYCKFLMECLKRSPNLKHFVLEKTWDDEQDEREWIFFDPPELPGCLVSHLQTISMKGFKGQRDEMEVVEFMLKNGRVLNTVSIHTASEGLLYEKEKLYKKLLTYKRGSGSCVILAD